MDISYNAWIRTTQEDHERLVCNFLQQVKEAGDIYKDKYEGYYCIGCEKYLDDEEMDAAKACLTHRTECHLRQEENWFFRLSRCKRTAKTSSQRYGRSSKPKGLSALQYRTEHGEQ